MKVSREQAAENRERIVEVASKLFRERGYEGIGVADLMKSAGLTHGGFYGHFMSKEDLMEKASAQALDESRRKWARRAADSSEKPLFGVTTSYLSTRHRDNPGDGCLFAALGSDAARQSLPLRHTVTEGLRSFIDLLTSFTPGKSEELKRQKALATCASLVGAMVLARFADDTALSDEILAATAESLT